MINYNIPRQSVQVAISCETYPEDNVNSVANPWHFGTDPNSDPDPRIRTSDWRIRMPIREAQNIPTDPTDPDADP